MNQWSRLFPDYQRFAHPIPELHRLHPHGEQALRRQLVSERQLHLLVPEGQLRGRLRGLRPRQPRAQHQQCLDFPQAIYNNNRYGYLPQDVRQMLKVRQATASISASPSGRTSMCRRAAR